MKKAGKTTSPQKNELLPGIKPVLDLAAANPEKIKKILVSGSRNDKKILAALDACQKFHIPVEQVSAKIMEDLLGSDRKIAHQGIMAILHPSPPVDLARLLNLGQNSPLPLIIALDQIKDPGNLGAIARSAYALGAAGLLLPLHNSAHVSPAAFKSSAGAISLLPICQAANLARSLDEAEEAGYSIYGADSHGSNTLNAFAMQWPTPLVIVLGSEETGLRPNVAKRCQAMIKIPFGRHFESLNVAQAAGMLMALFAACRQGQSVLP